MEITRIEKNEILQGFTFYTTKEVYLLVYDNDFWYSNIKYRGHCSIGSPNQNVNAIAFEDAIDLQNFISTNNLVKYEYTPTWDENWHEDTEKRIILTLEDNAILLQNVPELAVYMKEEELTSYIEGNYIYVYVNWIEEEHLPILQNFNAIIENK